MAKKICKGDSVFIPFRNGESISDSQLKPRMYMSRESFTNHFPGHYLGTKDVELVEYAPVVHGRWEAVHDGWGRCPNCHRMDSIHEKATHCRFCGTKMDGGVSDG